MPEAANNANHKPRLFTRHVMIALGLVTLALFLWKVAPVFMLAFAGVVLAAVLRAGAVPLAQRLHLPETAAVAVVALLGVLALIGAGYLFGQQVTRQATEMWDAIREASEKFQDFLSRSPAGETAVESVKDATKSSEEAASKVAKGTFTVFGAIADVLLVLFVALYLAVDPRGYRDGLVLLFPPAARDKLREALDAAGIALRKWLLGQLGAMVVVGLLTALGLWAIGVPMAIPLGILSGLLDFVPVVGPLVAAVPGVLIGFAQGPEVGLYAALVYLAVQFVEGNIVMPLAQKWAVSVPPALSLLGIVAFGLLFGVIGVLFAMPLLVVTMVLVQKLYIDRFEE